MPRTKKQNPTLLLHGVDTGLEAATQESNESAVEAFSREFMSQLDTLVPSLQDVLSEAEANQPRAAISITLALPTQAALFYLERKLGIARGRVIDVMFTRVRRQYEQEILGQRHDLDENTLMLKVARGEMTHAEMSKIQADQHAARMAKRGAGER